MISYRRAHPSDAAEFSRLCSQWGYPIPVERCEECLIRIGDSDRDAIFAAEVSPGRLGGWAHTQARHIIATRPFAEIVGIVVDENTRRRGIGKALIALCEDWASNRDFEKMHVKSNAIRSEAHGFYPGIGYQLVKIQRSYAKELKVIAAQPELQRG